MVRPTSATISGARPSEGSSISSTPRIAHQRAADREHLLLAARERARVLLGALLQPRKELEHALEAPAADLAALLIRDDQVLAHRQASERRACPAARGPTPLRAMASGDEALDRLAEQAHRALARRQEADDRVHAGGLAGAVAAEQREHPALAER